MVINFVLLLFLYCYCVILLFVVCVVTIVLILCCSVSGDRGVVLKEGTK